MASLTALSFDEEVRKHNSQTKGLNYINLKQAAADEIQRKVDDRRATQLQLTADLSNHKQTYEKEWEKLEEAISYYNKRAKATLEVLSQKMRSYASDRIGRAVGEPEETWTHMVMMEPSEIYIPEDIAEGGTDMSGEAETLIQHEGCYDATEDEDRETGSKYTDDTSFELPTNTWEYFEDRGSSYSSIKSENSIFEIPEDRSLSDEIRRAHNDIITVGSYMPQLFKLENKGEQVKMVANLRQSVKRQHLSLLNAKYSTLFTTQKLRAAENELTTLERLLDAKKQELETVKMLWISNWEELESQISKTDRDTIESFRNKYQKVWPLLRIGLRVRSRTIESLQDRMDQESDIIFMGNIAAHETSVLADALLYSKFVPRPLRRYDQGKFRAVYGVDVEFVERHCECEELINMLDIHGSLIVYRKN